MEFCGMSNFVMHPILCYFRFYKFSVKILRLCILHSIWNFMTLQILSCIKFSANHSAGTASCREEVRLLFFPQLYFIPTWCMAIIWELMSKKLSENIRSIHMPVPSIKNSVKMVCTILSTSCSFISEYTNLANKPNSVNRHLYCLDTDSQ